MKVKPVAFTGGVVWSSSDETVATVGQKRHCHRRGPRYAATITTTSVDKRSDGTTSSASRGNYREGPWTAWIRESGVSGPDHPEDGSAQWVDIDVNSLATTKLADAATSLPPAACSGKLYGTDSDSRLTERLLCGRS